MRRLSTLAFTIGVLGAPAQGAPLQVDESILGPAALPLHGVDPTSRLVPRTLRRGCSGAAASPECVTTIRFEQTIETLGFGSGGPSTPAVQPDEMSHLFSEHILYDLEADPSRQATAAASESLLVGTQDGGSKAAEVAIDFAGGLVIGNREIDLGAVRSPD